MMEKTLIIIHAVTSILLSLAILTQARGAGLSATFGGAGQFYVEKRGAEKVLFIITVVLAVLFVGISLAFIFI